MVRAVARGYLQSSVKRFLTRFNLTKREREVIALLAHGLKPKDICRRLHSSDKAVYATLARACKKTGWLDYYQLVGKLLEFTCQSLGHRRPNIPPSSALQVLAAPTTPHRKHQPAP